MLPRRPAASGVSLPTFQIQVTVDGTTTMLDACSDWTEDDVKAALNAEGRSGDCYYFVAGGGKPLNDSELTTLAALGVGQGDRIELRGRLLGGMGCGASKVAEKPGQSSDKRQAAAEKAEAEMTAAKRVLAEKASAEKHTDEGEETAEAAAEAAAVEKAVEKAVAPLWTALVDQWASDGIALPPSAEEAALATAATACLAAAEQAPCTHCGNRFAEQWGAAPWHCFACRKPIDPCRAIPEAAAKTAAAAVDAPFVRLEGDGLTAEGQERHAGRAVCVRWLLMLLGLLPRAVRRTITTGQLVARLIKPATARRRCHFVELPAMRGHVGAPRAFVSHTWSARFADLVAAIAHAVGEDAYVWLDIFAVRQWAGNVADLDFACAIRAAPVFLLVAMHLPEVAALSTEDANKKLVPASAKQKCAFYRVWCLVELNAALGGRKPVVMLIGAAGDDGCFVPERGMLNNLADSIDVEQAEASVPADRERELKKIEASDGGFGAINRLAIGALGGAFYAMDERAVLAAVAGDAAPLAALQEKEALGGALCGAAAGGFIAPLRALMERKVSVEGTTPTGRTALVLACQGGHDQCARALIEAKADIEAQIPSGHNALMLSAQNGHDLCARALIEAGANIETTHGMTRTALMFCAQNGHDLCARALIEAGAAVNAVENKQWTALMFCAQNGHDLCARALIEAGAEVDNVEKDGYNALMLSCQDGHDLCARALIEVKADLEKQISEGHTALMLSAQNGHDQCARALIEAKVDLEKQLSSGRTALMLSAQKGHDLCALIEAGADLEKQTTKGFTALMFSAQKGHDQCARALIEAKADLEKQTAKGLTALMLSAQKGHELCARTLVKAGSRKDVKNPAGDTALSLVQQSMAGAHMGVACDRSGMYPIVGNRYRSIILGEDLCESEFMKLTSQEQREWECIPPLTPPASLGAIAVLLGA